MSPPAWTASVLGRARSPMAWFQLVAGLWLFAAGVVLGLRSRLGVGPWDVLHDGIRHVTPLSFGVATILVGVVLLVAGALAGVRPGPGTLVNMVLIGIFSDAMLATGIGADLGARGLPMRLAAVVVGVLLVALGSALYIGAGLGSGPRDSLMRAFVARIHWAVLVTRRSGDGLQTSPVTVGVDGDGMATISTRETAYKVRNLRNDPSAVPCVFSDRFFGPWLQVEGAAQIVSLPEAMEPLVDYYRRISGEHPDWDDYRRAMEEQRRVLVRIEALPGQEAAVESFLRGGLPIVQQEPATITWYAIRLGPSTFGIFDTFPDQDGRQAHLSGQVAVALMENVGKLFGEPTIEQVDILAAKLPG